MPMGSKLRLLATCGLMLATLGTGAAQKDGHPEATASIAPPLAKDGVPTVVAIPAGSFVMGADAAALSDSITKGFGVMSTRPEHGDFDELPAHPVRITQGFN